MAVPSRSVADPFAQLDRAWAQQASRRRHTMTLRRWAAQSPALSDVTRLDDFLTDDRDRRRRYLDAVVDLVRAGDELAGEVLVQMLVPDQIELLAQLRCAPALTIAAERPPGVARLLDALHAAGIDLPWALCHDCNRDAVPLVVYLGVVRCGRCATRCPECGRYPS